MMACAECPHCADLTRGCPLGAAEAERERGRLRGELLAAIKEIEELKIAGIHTRAELTEARAEITRLWDAAAREAHDVEQILGKALGYPVAGPEIGGTGLPGGDVCVGEHVPASLAMEAVAALAEARAKIERLEQERD
jgi:hypothetical protein